MEETVIKKTTDAINRIMKEGIATTNIDNLYKLSKIKHYAKEDENMNYGNYGGRRYDTYGEYDRDTYGRRGYDMKYRGQDHINRMADEYGRYMESRERYGASEETDKSFHYMVKALEDFIRVLEEEADNPQQKQQLHEALQNAMR